MFREKFLDLFHVVLTSNTCIDGPELGEGVVAQLEGIIYKPGFGVAEELKLFFSGKDKMASTVDSYICLKRRHQECDPLPN